jgi:predicted GNAT superfamily acetyltransferase
MPSASEIEIRECTTIDEFEECVQLQREVFRFPDIEASPRRHFIVARRAGGWALGAFAGDELVGFVHNLVAVDGDRLYGYSHMLAVKKDYQNKGVGARLKWAQRERALAEGRRLIRWTWDPMQARNAHFNLNRLGVVVRSYAVNFYGTDYSVVETPDAHRPGIDSDRLFGEWELDSQRVERREARQDVSVATPEATIAIPVDWSSLIKEDPARARSELLRVRGEFEKAFESDLVCAGFASDAQRPRYLLFRKDAV